MYLFWVEPHYRYIRKNNLRISSSKNEVNFPPGRPPIASNKKQKVARTESMDISLEAFHGRGEVANQVLRYCKGEHQLRSDYHQLGREAFDFAVEEKNGC